MEKTSSWDGDAGDVRGEDNMGVYKGQGGAAM
jgi:hypothetical protein